MKLILLRINWEGMCSSWKQFKFGNVTSGNLGQGLSPVQNVILLNGMRKQLPFPKFLDEMLYRRKVIMCPSWQNRITGNLNKPVRMVNGLRSIYWDWMRKVTFRHYTVLVAVRNVKFGKFTSPSCIFGIICYSWHSTLFLLLLRSRGESWLDFQTW